MTPEAFRNWRSRLGITQREAAALLDRSLRWIVAYERGYDHRREPVKIPREIRLAMWAIEQGQEDWDG